MNRRVLLCTALSLLLLAAVNRCVASADDKPVKNAGDSRPPITGKKARGGELLDEVMLKYLDKIGCSGASLAVSSKGVLIYSRGYGWRDKEKRVPLQPDTLMGIASCEKAITAAAIRQLARNGKLDLEASVFKLLQIKRQGKIVDRRVWDITIHLLLDHKAGWQGEPIDRATQSMLKKGYKFPDLPPRSASQVETLLGFIMAEKLKDAPGTKYEYCNFYFDTLRHVIEKVSGQSAVDYYRRELFRPYGIRREIMSFGAPDSPGRDGEPPRVWNKDDGPATRLAAYGASTPNGLPAVFLRRPTIAIQYQSIRTDCEKIAESAPSSNRGAVRMHPRFDENTFGRPDERPRDNQTKRELQELLLSKTANLCRKALAIEAVLGLLRKGASASIAVGILATLTLIPVNPRGESPRAPILRAAERHFFH